MTENGVPSMREIERKYEAFEGLDLLDPAGLLGFETVRSCAYRWSAPHATRRPSWWP